MTWLTGTTTWANLAGDITRLICGEVASSGTGTNAATTAGGDQWVREFTRTVTDAVTNSTTTVTSATAAFTAADVGAHIYVTGLPTNSVIASITNGTTVVMSVAATASASGLTAQICHDTIRTKSALDVSTGSISNRCGYFANLGTQGMIAAGAAVTGGLSTVCRVTTGYTSDPSSSGFHRWIARINVQTANTVAGTYSNASIAYQVIDADSGSVLSNSTATPNSAGSTTIANGLVVSITDPSGILTVGTYFVRGFTSTYMRGIDLWPMLHRQGNTAPSFSVAPPGVNATDYDILTQACTPVSALTGIVADRGGLFHGLGIKTATGLGSGDLYTVSFSMALFKMRIFNSATNGLLSLDVGQSKVDTVNGNALRCAGGLRITNFCKMAVTSGSVTGSTVVQYWLSVKSDGIAFAFNADPGNTGKLGTAWVGAFTPSEATYDVFPMAFSSLVYDYTADMTSDAAHLGFQYSYLSLRRRQDGSEGTRDWQTKWMRCEHLNNTSFPGIYWSGTSYIDQTAPAVGTTSQAQLSAFVMAGFSYDNTTSNFPAMPARQNKPTPDGKWWLYSAQLGESGAASASWSEAGQSAEEGRWIRGTLTNRWYFIPGDGWASGDEFTDTGTSQKYLLLAPDYAGEGFGHRRRINSNSFQGGVAITEV